MKKDIIIKGTDKHDKEWYVFLSELIIKNFPFGRYCLRLERNVSLNINDYSEFYWVGETKWLPSLVDFYTKEDNIKILNYIKENALFFNKREEEIEEIVRNIDYYYTIEYSGITIGYLFFLKRNSIIKGQYIKHNASMILVPTIICNEKIEESELDKISDLIKLV